MAKINRLEDFDFPDEIDFKQEGLALLIEVRTSVGIAEGDANVVRETSFCEGKGAGGGCYTPKSARALKINYRVENVSED
jgi:hypothetical protein